MKLSLRMLGAAGLSFIMYNSSFIIRASGQTRSAVMVTNGTGKLAGPTNFFSANSNLLNQAIGHRAEQRAGDEHDFQRVNFDEHD